LAELGLIGLALLVGTLALPLAVAVRARRQALVPAAAAAYVAYLVHAGVDWDWEMPVVTVAALLAAVGILVAGRSEQARPLRPRVRQGVLAAVVALGAFAFVGLMGNYALAESHNARRAGDLARAEQQARRAIRWAPWSPEPWQALAAMHFERNDLPAARAALLKAIGKDRGDWALWYDLGVASTGPAKQRAYEHAARLNPRARNISVLRAVGVLPKLPEEKR
ncbi:MAG TPA: tetratricopeptide repeat protein, partial [Gaiellaceae bacterium]|nr:tetratricopeptide repeat protein [Gaiellaceae bacterium]